MPWIIFIAQLSQHNQALLSVRRYNDTKIDTWNQSYGIHHLDLPNVSISEEKKEILVEMNSLPKESCSWTLCHNPCVCVCVCSCTASWQLPVGVFVIALHVCQGMFTAVPLAAALITAKSACGIQMHSWSMGEPQPLTFSLHLHLLCAPTPCSSALPSWCYRVLEISISALARDLSCNQTEMSVV